MSMSDQEVCPICGDLYTNKDFEVNYHVDYIPEIITTACKGCNYAEYLIHHPEIKSKYDMERKIAAVRAWTQKNAPLIG